MNHTGSWSKTSHLLLHLLPHYLVKVECSTVLKYTCTGWLNKNRTFLRYHIFAATTYIIMRFLLKCSEITAENNKRNFFKQVLNIFCKVTGNGLRHTRLLDDDQPGLGWHCHRTVLKTTYPGHLCSRWTYWALPELGLIRHTWIVIKLCAILQH